MSYASETIKYEIETSQIAWLHNLYMINHHIDIGTKALVL
jgi:hypothetical protein